MATVVMAHSQTAVTPTSQVALSVRMRIAYFENNRHEAAQLVRSLEHHLPTSQEAVSCVCFDQVDALRSALRNDTFDLLLFDAGDETTPGIEMVRWLREHRESPMPVILLSSCAVDRQIAEALEGGADDYVLKPFRPMELRARIRKLMHRATALQAGGHKHLQPLARVERLGHWSFDHHALSVAIDVPETASPAPVAASFELTHREFVILIALFRRIGRVVSRAHLIEVAGLKDEDAQSRALDSHVYRLRKRVESHVHGRVRLRTIYAQGYRLEWVNGTAAVPHDASRSAETST